MCTIHPRLSSSHIVTFHRQYADFSTFYSDTPFWATSADCPPNLVGSRGPRATTHNTCRVNHHVRAPRSHRCLRIHSSRLPHEYRSNPSARHLYSECPCRLVPVLDSSRDRLGRTGTYGWESAEERVGLRPRETVGKRVASPSSRPARCRAQYAGGPMPVRFGAARYEGCVIGARAVLRDHGLTRALPT